MTYNQIPNLNAFVWEGLLSHYYLAAFLLQVNHSICNYFVNRFNSRCFFLVSSWVGGNNEYVFFCIRCWAQHSSRSLLCFCWTSFLLHSSPLSFGLVILCLVSPMNERCGTSNRIPLWSPTLKKKGRKHEALISISRVTHTQSIYLDPRIKFYGPLRLSIIWLHPTYQDLGVLAFSQVFHFPYVHYYLASGLTYLLLLSATTFYLLSFSIEAL